ncbi:hypothetical protein [Draconibacterium sediminis]|uniref:Uncharacterized protein n=1 Tax=Draconibacterium sediminis TaxID=1544798 RepID=A0A0D8J7J1_9BACT|nr:hypothetical protein [Draconibacterium sediminis]KJF42847.1 hypothetical protein LH29_15610 [Draconibacterium sediminis]
MKNKEFTEFINGLTPRERTDYIKSLSDGLLEYTTEIDKHREYLENLPTKELRIKEIERIVNEYTKRTNQ